MTHDSEQLEHLFSIPIGQPFGGGHERCHYYTYRSSHPLSEVREAYHTAYEHHPELSPAGICTRYLESRVSTEFWYRAVEMMPRLADLEDVEEDDEGVALHSDIMAAYVAEFILLGNPEIQLDPVSDAPLLTYGGLDSRGRGIGPFGYGLFR